MIKCENCGFENPDSRAFCAQCYRRLVVPDDNGEGDLSRRINELEKKLTEKDEEITKLRDQIESLHVDHPVIHTLRQHLDAKEVELQKALKDLFHARQSVLVPASPPGAELMIESYPIRRPHYDIAVDSSTNSIDLTATEYRIRATLERTANGLEIVVHRGADVNVRPSEKQTRWTRCTEGNRIKVDAGTIVYDPKGAMNARLALPS